MQLLPPSLRRTLAHAKCAWRWPSYALLPGRALLRRHGHTIVPVTLGPSAMPGQPVAAPPSPGPAPGDSEFVYEEEPYMLKQEYGPWGFYPMRLGQMLHHGRYEVVRKLGYGQSASVWLAQEHRADLDGPHYVAIKILSTNATYGDQLGHFHDLENSRALCELSESDRAHPGYPHCAKIFEIFEEESAHGTHSCIVSALYGKALGNLLSDPYAPPRLARRTVKRIAHQVLLGLSLLHDRLNMVHTDVKPMNIVVQVEIDDSEISRFIKENPALVYSKVPPVDPSISLEAVPALCSQPLPNFGLDPSYDNLNVTLVDFGSAIRADKIIPNMRFGTPPVLRAPEQILGHEWSKPIDVWAVGCLIFELLSGERPFSPVYSNERHLALIYDFLGCFPMDFLRGCRNSEELIGPDGVPLGEPCAVGSLERQLAIEFKGSSAQELSEACRFLRRCFAIDPSKRATVSELLADEWLASASD